MFSTVSAIHLCILFSRSENAALKAEIERLKEENTELKSMYGSYGPTTPPPPHIADFRIGLQPISIIFNALLLF